MLDLAIGKLREATLIYEFIPLESILFCKLAYSILYHIYPVPYFFRMELWVYYFINNHLLSTFIVHQTCVCLITTSDNSARPNFWLKLSKFVRGQHLSTMHHSLILCSKTCLLCARKHTQTVNCIRTHTLWTTLRYSSLFVANSCDGMVTVARVH